MLLKQEQRATGRSRGAGLVALALAAGLCCCAQAAERVRGQKVRFSDSRERPVMLDGTQKDPTKSFGGLLDRNSSLGGVEAVPFSSVYPPASRQGDSSLSLRERDLLDQRNNWIRLTPDDVALTDKSASKAFGVREYSLEDLQGERQSRKGDLARYLEKMEDKSRRDQDKAETDSLEKRAFHTLGVEPAKADKEELASTKVEFGQARDTAGLGLRDLGLLTRWGEKWLGRERETAVEGLVQSGLRDLFKDGVRAPGLSRFQPGRTDTLLRRPAGEADSTSFTKPLLGALDPVNFQPDLTRQQLNPILGQTITPASQAAGASFSEATRPVGTAGLFTRPGVVDGLSLGAAAPALSPALTLPTQPPKERFSPARYEIPNRPF